MSLPFKQLVIASGNQGKIREIAHVLTPFEIEILPQSQFNVPECEEPFCTFVENALAKARHASKHTGLPALADDSGLCVNALQGAPGVLSARYAGTVSYTHLSTLPRPSRAAICSLNIGSKLRMDSSILNDNSR